MDILLLSIAQILMGFVIAGACVLFWCVLYSWFAENRKHNDEFPRSAQSWNNEHTFFDTITEFRNDFSRD